MHTLAPLVAAFASADCPGKHGLGRLNRQDSCQLRGHCRWGAMGSTCQPGMGAGCPAQLGWRTSAACRVVPQDMLTGSQHSALLPQRPLQAAGSICVQCPRPQLSVHRSETGKAHKYHALVDLP